MRSLQDKRVTKAPHIHQVWKKPFYCDEYSLYVWSANGAMALTFTGVNKEDRQKIVDALNRERKIKSGEFSLQNGTELCYNGQMIALIRGWGNLHGVGGHYLDFDVAAKVHDKFCNWIVKTLNQQVEEDATLND